MGLISVFLVSCSTKVLFESSSVVPLASGELTVKEVDDDNYLIEADIQYLTEPENLGDNKRCYVVWVKEDEELENVGMLHLTDDMEASVIAHTSLDPEWVLISAEPTASVDQMSGRVVLKTPEMDF